MNNQVYYPIIFSKYNIVFIIVITIEWCKSPGLSLLLSSFLIIYFLFVISTYKVEKNNNAIKFYRFLGVKELKWSEVTKFEYEKISFVWPGIFIYFFAGNSWYRFNIFRFDKLLLNEIIDQCKISGIPVRNTT